MCAAVGVAAGAISSSVASGAAAFLAVPAVLAGWALFVLFRLRYRTAGRYRERLAVYAAGPQGEPPPTAVATDNPLPGRYADAVTRRDREAVAGYLDEDYVCTHPLASRPITKKLFLRAMSLNRLIYADAVLKVDAVLADPAAPDALWVHFTQRARPHSGPERHASSWERWTLDAAGERIVSDETIAITDVQ